MAQPTGCSKSIAREVDFSEAEACVAATYSHGGRPATRVGVLLRVMILQHLYGLTFLQHC